MRRVYRFVAYFITRLNSLVAHHQLVFYVFIINFMIYKQIFFIITLIALSSQKIAIYNSQVANAIFSNKQIYLLLFQSSNMSSQIQTTFQKVCESFSNCAKITKQGPQFSHIKQFIGFQSQDFIAIIDAQNKLKYVLALFPELNEELIFQFIDQFQKNQLEPYYASQPLPESYQPETTLFKLVGLNYEWFLGQEEPIKILYLYSSQQYCQSCESYLQKFKKIAAKHHQNGVMLFGFIDVVLNDNKYIRDEIFPYFIIYVRDNFQDPFGVDTDQFKQLQLFIEQLKKQVKPHKSQDLHEQHQEQHQKQSFQQQKNDYYQQL